MIYRVFPEDSLSHSPLSISSPVFLKIGSHVYFFDGRDWRKGFVVGEGGEPEGRFLGLIDDFLDEERVELALWISKRYGNPPSSVLSLSFPSQLDGYIQVRVAPSEGFYVFEEEELSSFVEKKGRNELKKLLSNGLAQLKVEWREPKVRVRKEETVVLKKSFSEILRMDLSADEMRVVQRLMETGIMTYRELFREFIDVVVLSLERKGVIGKGSKKKRITLREDQEEAVRSAAKGSNLLVGPTGSGKTEVYIELMRGKKTLYLLPEVSLVWQVVRRIEERIKGIRVGVYHSYLSSGRRTLEWLKAVEGKTDVLVGTRSALFVPVKWDLIVIDEQHDESFYQREGVVYDAVESAKRLSQLYEVPLIMGSATPRLFEWVDERVKKLFIKRTLPAPSVELVDLREEEKAGSFAVKVFEDIERVLKRGKGVMVFVRRKGFGRVVCERCGYVHKCENCDVTMTYHASTKTFKCHVCGYEEKAFGSCPVCGGVLKVVGTGTERVERELKKVFPERRIERVDREVFSRPDLIVDVLDRFSRGEVDVIVGTRMISKGIDVPRVGLMVVTDVDGMLSFPDHTARLRTFQLLIQAVGRAGREGGGRAIIQHWGMDKKLLSYAVEGDVVGFYEDELERRRLFRYPPFAHLIHVLYSSYDKRLGKEIIEEVASRIEGEKILGPSEYMLPRIKGKFTHHFLIKTDDPEKALLKMRNAMAKVEKRGFKIFIDPPSIYVV